MSILVDKNQLKEIVVDKNTLLRVLNITDRKMRLLINEGIIISIAKDKYLLYPSIGHYINYLTSDISIDQKGKKREQIISDQIKKLQQVQDKCIEKELYDYVAPIAKAICNLSLPL